MDYQFENLGPERFQQFCQSLLVKEFPKLQCFPVAQPDGGRDAISYIIKPNTNDFIIFQVKFVRKPLAESEPHKWLLDITEKESPKVKSLIPKGAKEFYLITNIPGTAHPDVGSIDLMNKILRDNIGIPSFCWWREDISRRLDSLWDLKWAYPEVMTGQDIIRSIVESGLSENNIIRTAKIKAFIRDQYEIDQEVRFKQVELQNRLLDLFVDVPIAIGPNHNKGQQSYYKFLQSVEEHLYTQDDVEPIARVQINEGTLEYWYVGKGDKCIGAATMLLHPLVQQSMTQMVLEGAPGQGKSTIAQYVCQVHRMRLLNKSEDLEAIPEHHRAVPVRIPFKIDLRHLATWLNKKDPFSSEENNESPAHWHKSLESFLAAQVRHHSGGGDFLYEDLIAILRISAVLLVFDGLDEVADISKRQEVVDEIIKGVNRLQENAVSLQVLVTSRPAAFANSPGLPDHLFPYYQLESLPRPLIDIYADKWLKARRLRDRESAEVKKILKDKLDQPHLRDLARNPMQLAILLSLIHTRGSSLPDKRTALYDSYVELFFNRESEKSLIVREHRDLLIDIHGYLAWMLHSESEQGHTSGTISSEKLQDTLLKYLSEEGHDTSLAKLLFTGMVERVVALVSRVEGTYEFEVQPLREYFAARYLYETAPYSPPGIERRGTKPDRFDAIARNFYWLNVTRFYAGCFDKGELASLVDRLQELINEDGYRHISHPRILAATLLSDWVFTQHPKSMKEVVTLILDGLGLRYVLASNNRRLGVGHPLILPSKCGRDELIDHCFTILRTKPPRDYAFDIIELIKANSTPSEIEQKWITSISDDHINPIQWLEYGLHVGVLSNVPIEVLEELHSRFANSSIHINFLFRAKRFDYCENSEDRCNSVIQAILNREISAQTNRRAQSILELFNHALDPSRYAIAFNFRQPVPLTDVWERVRGRFSGLNKEKIKIIPKYESLKNCIEIIDIANKESTHAANEWASELTPWDNIVEKSRSLFGEQWAHCYIANVAAGIKSSQETCVEYPDLLDYSKSLCRRVRYARLRSGVVAWWKNQLETVTTEFDRMLTAAVILTWGSANTLITLFETIEVTLNNLTKEMWQSVMHTVQSSISLIHESPNAGSLSLNINQLPPNLSERIVAAFGTRAKPASAYNFYTKYLSHYQGLDPIVLDFCQKQALDITNFNSPTWQPNLKLIARIYSEGISVEPYTFHEALRYQNLKDFPTNIAEEIAEHPDKYPSYLVVLAETKCRQIVGKQIIPVGKIAQDDNWFV